VASITLRGILRSKTATPSSVLYYAMNLLPASSSLAAIRFRSFSKLSTPQRLFSRWTLPRLRLFWQKRQRLRREANSSFTRLVTSLTAPSPTLSGSARNRTILSAQATNPRARTGIFELPDQHCERCARERCLVSTARTAEASFRPVVSYSRKASTHGGKRSIWSRHNRTMEYPDESPSGFALCQTGLFLALRWSTIATTEREM